MAGQPASEEPEVQGRIGEGYFQAADLGGWAREEKNGEFLVPGVLHRVLDAWNRENICWELARACWDS